jgi:hypothetical protein
MDEVLLKGGAVNQNVVEKDKNTFAKKRFEGGIHCALESVWSTSETKRHDGVFKMTPMCLEGGLVLFARS